MNITLNKQEAAALLAGQKSQHRLPIIPVPEVLVEEDLFGSVQGERYAWPSANAAPLSVEELARACPIGPAGASVKLFERKAYGQAEPIQSVQLARVRVERLEQITDAEIQQEGYPNWTEYAAGWNQHHAAGGAPWDINPLVWVIEFVEE